MFTGKLSLAATIVLLGVASASSDAYVYVLKQDVERRGQEAGCHNVFFNIDVTLQGLGSQCGKNSMDLIGKMLQDIPADLVKEIPESDDERMEAFVCPVPSVGGTRRALFRAASQQRRLLDYTYKIGGLLTCDHNNRARRSLTDEVGTEAVCEFAKVATLTFKVAAKTSRQARAAFRKQTKQAMECSELSARDKAIAKAESFTKAIRKATSTTRTGARKAKKICELAKAATSEVELIKYMQQAQKASTSAMGAVRLAQSSYAEMIRNTNVCNPGIENKNSEEDVTPTQKPGNDNEDSGKDVTPTQKPGNENGDNEEDVTPPKQAEIENENNEKDVTPLKGLLIKLSQKLYEKIPDRIVEEGASIGPECLGKGVQFSIGVDGVEQMEDVEFWIGSIDECTKLQ